MTGELARPPGEVHSMRIKSYFAAAVEDAMAQARQELGPEAMLVNSRKAPPEARHLGEYEVVFAAENAPGQAEGAAAQVQLQGGNADRLAIDVASLKNELEGMRRALVRSAFAPARWSGVSPTASEAYAALAAQEVLPSLAREIVEAAEARVSAARTTVPRAAQSEEKANWRQALVEEVRSRFTVEPSLGRGESPPRVAALVGPSGSGKTTTLVKLAVQYGLASRRPVVLLSVDTFRIAAAAQLRSFAAILGVGLQVLETVGALAQAIEENRGKDLILIDTPGFGPADMEADCGLAHFLSSRSDIDTHLVLSSSMKAADVTRMVDRFEIFRPQRMLFTRLDETESLGPIFNEAARTGKPLSFFANGQRIPEDLEAVTWDRLVERLLGTPASQAASVA
jgi:flagellar biosynthesis protein FlhF